MGLEDRRLTVKMGGYRSAGEEAMHTTSKLTWCSVAVCWQLPGRFRTAVRIRARRQAFFVLRCPGSLRCD